MESLVQKIIYLFILPKISVVFLATVVKTIFTNFLNFFCKTKKNVQISISPFCQEY